MFEQALVLKTGNTPDQADIGLLAETLFFYGSVHLLLNAGALTAHVKRLPERDFLQLLERDEVKFSYLRPLFAVLTDGVPPLHDFGALTLHAEGVGKKPLNFREDMEVTLERTLGTSTKTKRYIQRIIDQAKLHKFDGLSEKEKTIPDLARADAKDNAFIESAARLVLNYLVPEYNLPQNFRFRLIGVGPQLAADTNLDFQAINAIYRKRVPVEHSTVSPAHILSHIIDARADSFFAAYYMAEPVTSPIYSDLIKLKHFDFLRRRVESVDQQAQFRDLVVPDFPTIRESINSGNRSFEEFLQLLDRAQKFKSWIRTANPDAGLIQSYHRAATEATWADKIPTRSVRFVVATGLGLMAEAIAPSGIGAGLGLSVGAADSLLLDRLIKGWRPNQFVTGPLTDFLRGPPRP